MCVSLRATIEFPVSHLLVLFAATPQAQNDFLRTQDKVRQENKAASQAEGRPSSPRFPALAPARKHSGAKTKMEVLCRRVLTESAIIPSPNKIDSAGRALWPFVEERGQRGESERRVVLGKVGE